ncbi:MAG: ArsR/SmtB family transcription factor [Gammaproteobacteria bacterium]
MTYETQFAALGNPIRQNILNALAQSPASVRELTDQIAVSQPVMSQHLKVLREADLVQITPRGKKNIYRLDPDALSKLRAYLEQHWLAALQNLDPKESPND